MKRRNVKWMAAVLMVTSLITMQFTGCQKSSGTEKEATPQQTTAQTQGEGTAKTEELKPVKLVWYMLNPPQKDPNPIYEAANKMIQEKINATVEFKTEDYGTMEEKMKMVIASGEEFDITWTSHWLNKYEPNVDRGAFLALDELIDKYAPKTKQSIPQTVWDMTKVKGKIYGVPNYQIVAAQTGLAVNKTLVEQYGLGDISAIKKYEDIEPLLVACKEKAPGIFPLAEVNDHGRYPESVGNEPIPGLPVGLQIDKNNKIVDPLGPIDQYDRARKELNRKWIQQGLVMDPINQKNASSLANAGKVLFIYSQVKPGGEAERKLQTGHDWVIIPTQKAFLDRPTSISTLQAVSVTSKNPERAMMLMELINTDKELYNLLVFGIEGKQYTKVGDNRIEPIKDSGYTNLAWGIGNQFNAYLLPGQPDDVWEKTMELNKSATPYRAATFVLDQSPVSNEIKAINAVYSDTMIKNLIFASDWDVDKSREEVNKKRKEAGMEKYIAEVQKQLDAYFASKK